MDYSTAPTQQAGGGDLIPKGTLAFAIVALRPFNEDQGLIEVPSKSSDGAYLDLELTIEGGPYDRRKIWDKIGVRGSEKWVQSGHAAVRHMLEVGRGAGPQNMAGYVIDSYMELDGLKVAIRVGIEKGKDGYEDKNNVRYLSPNPESDTCKDFARLRAGDTAPKAATAPAATAAPAWGAPATPAAPATQIGVGPAQAAQAVQRAYTPAAASGTIVAGAGAPGKPSWL